MPNIKERCFVEKACHWIWQEKVELWIFKCHLLGGLPVCAVKDVHGGHGEPLCKLRDHLPGFGLISHFEHFAWNLQNCFPCSIFSPGQKLISVVGDGSLLLHCGAQGCECRGVLEIKHKDSQLIWGLGKDFHPIWNLAKNQNWDKNAHFAAWRESRKPGIIPKSFS